MCFRQHILIVTNSLSVKDAEQIKQTINNYPEANIKLSLVFVMPNIPTQYYQLPSLIELQTHRLTEVQQHLQAIGHIMNVPVESQWVKTGKLKNEVPQLAQSLNVDIVISDSLANPNTSPALDPILTKKHWRQAGKITSRRFKEYLINLADCAIPALIA